jgi:hypothetical protein
MVLTRSFRSAWFDQSSHDRAGSESGSQLDLQLTAGQARLGQNLRFDLKTATAAEPGKYIYERRQLLEVSVKQVTDDHDKDGDAAGGWLSTTIRREMRLGTRKRISIRLPSRSQAFCWEAGQRRGTGWPTLSQFGPQMRLRTSRKAG